MNLANWQIIFTFLLDHKTAASLRMSPLHAPNDAIINYRLSLELYNFFCGGNGEDERHFGCTGNDGRIVITREKYMFTRNLECD